MNIRIGGLDSRKPAMSLPWPVRGGCNVYLSAGHWVSRNSNPGPLYSPLKLLRPSVVNLPPVRILYGLSSCKTLPTVNGYVSSRVA
jgi:hypothetical protein